MNLQGSFIIVLVTAKDTEEARKIANGLLAEHLVACANIIDRIESLFWWQGRVDEAYTINKSIGWENLCC